MSDFYIRKFLPNKKHIISFIFIIISVVFFISGFYRACRISGRLTMTGLTFEPEVHKGDSILLSSSPFKARLKDTEYERDVCFMSMSAGIVTNYECFIVHVAGKYRPVMVETGSAEYEKVLSGEEVSGYFTERNFECFPEFMLNMDKYYDVGKFTEEDISTLGIVVVNYKKEVLSFMWGIPFLIIGLILFKIAGSPFFYVPEMLETNLPKTDSENS